MTPVLADILTGQAAALGAPQPPEALGDYLAGRLGILSMLALLAAQEAERGPAARVWENAAIRSLFGRASGAYDGDLMGRLAAAATAAPGGFAWSVLDADNAGLRRLLIALHEAAEARNDKPLDREILELYDAMAQARRLDLPSALA
jgi:hypothetical protein